MITFDEFKKVEMKVGQILKAEPVEGSDKLLQLEVDFGEDKTRTVVSGIAGHVDLETFVGSKKVFITNVIRVTSTKVVIIKNTCTKIFN